MFFIRSYISGNLPNNEKSMHFPEPAYKDHSENVLLKSVFFNAVLLEINDRVYNIHNGHVFVISGFQHSLNRPLTVSVTGFISLLNNWPET